MRIIENLIIQKVRKSNFNKSRIIKDLILGRVCESNFNYSRLFTNKYSKFDFLQQLFKMPLFAKFKTIKVFFEFECS